MKFVRLLFLLLSMMTAALASAGPKDRYTVLCYHDVVASLPDQYYGDSVETGQLARHFAWLRENGYKVISADDLLAAQQGRQPLPERAVLLSFDDGYRSFYTQVFPLLQAFNYPAVLAIVGEWLAAPAGQTVEYGDSQAPRDNFLTWEQIREMKSSGLVEIASHSYGLHRGIIGNPQGNSMPAATTRRYDAASGQYESVAAYQARVRADLARNSALIAKETGAPPRIMVWPYGRHQQPVLDIAREVGMPITMTLEPGSNRLDDGLSAIRRYYIESNPGVPEVAELIRDQDQAPRILRAIHVNLDDVHHDDATIVQGNMDRLLDRIRDLGVNSVFLHAHSENTREGGQSALYFPTAGGLLRADLLSHVAWQIGTRSSAKVFGWLKSEGLGLPAGGYASAARDLALLNAVDGLVIDLPPGQPNDSASPLLAAGLSGRPLLATGVTYYPTPQRLSQKRPPEAQWLVLRPTATDLEAGAETNFPPAWLKAVARGDRIYVDLPARGTSAADRHEGALGQRLRALQAKGITSFGYHPDDYLAKQPPLEEVLFATSVKRMFSTRLQAE